MECSAPGYYLGETDASREFPYTVDTYPEGFETCQRKIWLIIACTDARCAECDSAPLSTSECDACYSDVSTDAPCSKWC